jgi:hypothetical protein
MFLQEKEKGGEKRKDLSPRRRKACHSICPPARHPEDRNQKYHDERRKDVGSRGKP